MTSFARALAAAYYLPAAIYGELGFILALAITASKAVGAITGDPTTTLRQRRGSGGSA
jgi:hypothetical protein